MCRERQRIEPRTLETFIPEIVDPSVRERLIELAKMMKDFGGKESIRKRKQIEFFRIISEDKYGRRVSLTFSMSERSNHKTEDPFWGISFEFGKPRKFDFRFYHRLINQSGEVVYILDNLDPPNGVMRIFQEGQAYINKKSDSQLIPLERCKYPRSLNEVVDFFWGCFEIGMSN